MRKQQPAILNVINRRPCHAVDHPAGLTQMASNRMNLSSNAICAALEARQLQRIIHNA